MTGEEVAKRALREVRTPFRLHGRQPGVALDCIGLVAHALGLKDVPISYGLRGSYEGAIRAYLDCCGGRQLSRGDTLRNGDIALVLCAPRQYHLMTHAGSGWVHAHAGLRRVVHTPDPSPWPILKIWRICGD